MKNKNKLILFLIILLALILRVIRLSENPPSLNWDEVSHGYNAYSILKTGKDEWGMLLPITNFRAYGDYPLPFNLYLTIPFIAVLGLNAFAIRLPHAILGVLTVVASYFLSKGVTKSEKVSLITSLLVAIDPWTLFTSRFVLQPNLSVFFLTAAMAAFFNRQKNKFLLPLSFFLFGLTLFSYHSTRIFTPLILVVIFFIYKKELLKISIASFILLLFLLPLPVILANPESRARSSVVFLLNEGAVNKIIESRNSSGLPPSISRLVNNKAVYFIKEFAKNYISYYSPDFLFLKGGTQYQFSIPGRGVLLWVNLPFFYLGVYWILRKALKGKKDYKILVLWLFLSPIPASITIERFAVLRASTMLPLPEIMTAIGLFAFWNFIKSNRGYLLLVYMIILALSLESYMTDYFGSYKTEYSWAWQYGYKEVVSFAKENYQKYDKIIVTKKYGEPHEFFLFNWPWDPGQYKNDPNLIRFYQSNWYWVDSFDKFYFVNDWQIPKSGSQFVLESKKTVDCLAAKCLLITSPQNYPAGWKKQKTINFLDGKPAFDIYEN